VGVFETTNNTFYTVAIPGELHASAVGSGSGSKKYAGAAAVGTTAYFAPHGYYDESFNIGVFDAATDVFSTVALSPDLEVFDKYHFNDKKYDGAAVVGTKVGWSKLP